MGLSHAYMVEFVHVLLSRPVRVKQRHEYLMYLHKAQYDPTKPNFISMKALTMGNDKEFVRDVAKTSTKHYYNFLKTLWCML